ncbi:hypothetical protein CM15mP35_00820 [bacterium]|nr:MAG: hypothetical protein CM15mP35_00820 [bacterium]
MIRNIDNLIFIGHKEYLHGMNEFKNIMKKLNFYHLESIINSLGKKDNEKKTIFLFIGNDSNRDFKFLKQLALNMPERKFVVVTEQKEEELKILKI